MTSDKPTPEEGSNRRQYLKHCSSALVPVAFTSSVSASGKRRKIGTQRNKEGIVKKREVPQSWFAHIRAVRQARKNVEERVRDLPQVQSIGSYKSEKKFGGLRGQHIKVGVKKGASQKKIPNESNGIRVETTEAEEIRPLSCGGFTSNINPAPGGVECNGDEWGTATLGVEVDGINQDDLLLTCAHLWNDYCSTDITNKDGYQGGNHYGKVEQFDDNTDWAVIDGADGIYGDEESKAYIKDTNGEHKVNTWYIENGIDILIGDDESVKKMGTTTGVTSGEIQGKDINNAVNCITFGGEGIYVRAESAPGDSGAPSYRINDEGKAVMVGTVNVGGSGNNTHQCNGKSLESGFNFYGNSFYHLHNEFGIKPK